jgi:hypothetical protein
LEQNRPLISPLLKIFPKHSTFWKKPVTCLGYLFKNQEKNAKKGGSVPSRVVYLRSQLG